MGEEPLEVKSGTLKLEGRSIPGSFLLSISS